MKITDKRVVLKRIHAVQKIAEADISGHAQGGKVASGLSNEGFAGGYLAALRDVEAALIHGYPTDTHRYWSRAENT